MKRIYICILCVLGCLTLTSCKKITIVNEVINRVVNYEENISKCQICTSKRRNLPRVLDG